MNEILDVKGYKLTPGFVQSSNKQKASPITHVSTIYDGDKNLQDIIDEIIDEKNKIPEVDRVEVEINPGDWVEKEDGSFGYDYTDPLLTDQVLTEVAADKTNMDLIVKDKIRWMLTEDVIGNTVTIYSEKRPTVKLKLQIIRYTKYFLINLAIKDSDWAGDKLRKFVYQDPDIFAKYLALFRMNRANIRLFLDNNYAITNTTDGQVEIVTDNPVTLNAQSVFLYTDLLGNIPNGDGNIEVTPPATPPVTPSVSFRKKLLYKNKDNFDTDKLTVVDVSFGMSTNSVLFWYYTGLWVDMEYSKVYIGSLPRGSEDHESMTVPRDRLEFSNKLPPDYLINNNNNNILYSKLVPANAIDGFIVIPGYLIKYREYNVVQSDTKSRFKIIDMTRLPSMKYATSQMAGGYEDSIDSACSEYSFDGLYIVYSRKSRALKLMKVQSNGSEVFNVTISNNAGTLLYRNDVFMYKDKLYILSFNGYLDDYNTYAAFIVRVSKNNGNIEDRYNFATHNANSRGQIQITGYCVIGNILYARFNNEDQDYTSHIVRFNLDTFTYMNTAPITGFKNTRQRYNFDAHVNNMRAIDNNIYTIFVGTDRKRYLVRLSPEDFTILNKVELAEKYNRNCDPATVSVNLITENDNLFGYFPDIYQGTKPESIGVFANPRSLANGFNGILVEEIYVDRDE